MAFNDRYVKIRFWSAYIFKSGTNAKCIDKRFKIKVLLYILSHTENQRRFIHLLLNGTCHRKKEHNISEKGPSIFCATLTHIPNYSQQTIITPVINTYQHTVLYDRWLCLVFSRIVGHARKCRKKDENRPRRESGEGKMLPVFLLESRNNERCDDSEATLFSACSQCAVASPSVSVFR